jgi:hypothetical protein
MRKGLEQGHALKGQCRQKGCTSNISSPHIHITFQLSLLFYPEDGSSYVPSEAMVNTY